MANNTDNTAITKAKLGGYRPTRKIAIEIGALVVVITLAVLIRVLPLQYGSYYTAYDPLFQYRVTEYVVENGYSAWFTWHDDISWYPMGRDIAASSYPGIPLTAAFVYNVLSLLGLKLTVYNFGLYFPLMMASFTVISTYFLGKEIKGKAVGIFGALFVAINPAFISRTSLGFFDTENIGLFSMVTLPIFLLKSSEEKRKIEEKVVFGVLSGLLLGFIFASWGAAKYVNGLIVLYMLILMYTERFELRHLTSYCLTIGIGYSIVLLVPRLGGRAILGLDYLVGIVMVGVMIAYIFIKEKVDIQVLANITGLIIILGVLAVFILPAIGIDIPIGTKFLKAINPFTSGTTPLYQSISENHVMAWVSFFQDFGIIIILGVLGFYLAAQKQNEKTLYLSVFFLTAVYFAGIMSRLSQILAVPACIMGAYGLVELATPFFKLTTPLQDRKSRRRKQVFGMNRYLGAAFIVIILLTMVPNTWRVIRSADAPTSLASSAVPYQFDEGYVKDWPEALDWMKNNVSDDEIICSWWDYGYWIQAMAGRITMADGSTSNYKQIANIGKILMLPQNESIKILEEYGADYVLVFFVSDPNNPNISLNIGDDVKWSWMVQIAGLNITEYRNPMDGRPTEKYYDSTLARLMYGGWDTHYFTEAYFSPHGYVRIFNVNYPE